MAQVSIVIPLFNQWDLTRACLRSIKATTPADAIEVILVDNASTDITPKAAPFLGRELFGGQFTYIRNDINRNFAGASNQGAAAASSDFLLFLNNDTVLLPGWLPPLLADFSQYSRLAGTGPLLLYPEKPLIGHTIQHLGVCVYPLCKVGHLYEGIPASSPLAKKRRFFQVITAACLMMPRKIFQKAGGFDEGFRNGFEDVDLCARLHASGYQFTVNPESRVIHYQGQSAGRHAAESHNSKRLLQKSFHLLMPDFVEYLKKDGMGIGLNDWQLQVPLLAPDVSGMLDSKMDSLDQSGLLESLVDYPYWSGGWKQLLSMVPDKEKVELSETVFILVPEPAIPINACRAALSLGDIKRVAYWFYRSNDFYCAESDYLKSCEDRASRAFSLGQVQLGKAYVNWVKTSPQFFKEKLRPFIADFTALAKQLKIQDISLLNLTPDSGKSS